jgi:hypothetical protein
MPIHIPDPIVVYPDLATFQKTINGGITGATLVAWQVLADERVVAQFAVTPQP